MYPDNKILGICKEVSENDGNILLQTKDNPDGQLWMGLGDRAKKAVRSSLRGTEIELTIVDQTKRTFSYLKVLNGDV